MKFVEIRPWRESPFVTGRRYRVRRSFEALRDTFQGGEVLTYERDAYSRYDGLTGYFFSQPGSDRLRAWDISDDQDLETWRQFFEEIQAETPGSSPQHTGDSR